MAFTVNPIFLTVLYFSDLETQQNLTPLILVSTDNTHNIQYIIFTSSRDNILVLLRHSRNSGKYNDLEKKIDLQYTVNHDIHVCI